MRENTAHSLAPANGPTRPLSGRAVDQLVPKPLVISFAVIMRDVLVAAENTVRVASIEVTYVLR